MRNEIHELKTTYLAFALNDLSSAKIFQLNKCTYCTSPLDLPAVHFLCMHSFHQRCLGENEQECPGTKISKDLLIHSVCAPQNKKIFEIKRALEDNIGQHDQFFKQVHSILLVLLNMYSLKLLEMGSRLSVTILEGAYLTKYFFIHLINRHFSCDA